VSMMLRAQRNFWSWSSDHDLGPWQATAGGFFFMSGSFASLLSMQGARCALRSWPSSVAGGGVVPDSRKQSLQAIVERPSTW